MSHPLPLQKYSFLLTLLTWYRASKRSLPWRNIVDPYKIWVSEIMLQQTTVKAVIPFYQKWIQRFPTLESLAKAPLQDILKTWEGLGYYQRARNMHRAAKIMRQDHHACIPSDHASLIKLPGFGPYTTAAVLSLAFDQPYSVLDANVRRIMVRLLRIKKTDGSNLDKRLSRKLHLLIPEKGSGEFNQALMELGALICKPHSPSCLLCPVWTFCQAYHTGEQEIIPSPKKRKFEKIEAVVGIIQDRGKYLIQKRPSKGLLAGLWEFPGGKRNKGETLEYALAREIKEELDAEIQTASYLTRVTHAYTRFQVVLHAYTCILKDTPRLQEDRYRWITLNGFKRYPLPSGSVKIVRYLEEKKKKTTPE